MQKKYGVTKVWPWALALGLLLLPTFFLTKTAEATQTTFGQPILPLECLFNIVNDGTNQIIYLTPEECGQLPDEEPSKKPPRPDRPDRPAPPRRLVDPPQGPFDEPPRGPFLYTPGRSNFIGEGTEEFELQDETTEDKIDENEEAEFERTPEIGGTTTIIERVLEGKYSLIDKATGALREAQPYQLGMAAFIFIALGFVLLDIIMFKGAGKTKVSNCLAGMRKKGKDEEEKPKGKQD